MNELLQFTITFFPEIANILLKFLQILGAKRVENLLLIYIFIFNQGALARKMIQDNYSKLQLFNLVFVIVTSDVVS